MDLNVSFKSAQSKFYDWTTKWAQDGENPENNRTPDLVDLITIFQILGFSISLADSHNPHEMSALNCGQRGLKINISCSHSGARFVLEGVNVCSCPEKMINCVRETMSNPDVVQRTEVYSKMRFLNVPKGEKLVIQTVLTHLVNMMHSSAKDNDQNENMFKEAAKTQEGNQNMQVIATEIHEEDLMAVGIVPKNNVENINLIEDAKTPCRKENPTYEGFFTPSEVIIKQEKNKSPTEEPTSPCRYRSLDTLTGKDSVSDQLPEPGQLNKNEKSETNSVPILTYSSPNLSIVPTASIPTNTSSPVTNVAILKQGYSKLLSVQELVKDVIEIFEKSQEIPKFSFDVSTIKVSTESLSVKKPPHSSSDPNLVTKRIVKPLCRPSIRSTSSVKSTASSTSSGTLTVKPSARDRKSSENISPTYKTNTFSSGSKSQKFAHVKSTIPKGSVPKK